MPKRLGTTGLEALEPLGAFVHAFFHKNICLILLWRALSQALRTIVMNKMGTVLAFVLLTVLEVDSK